jgi:hypothetical protein
METWLDNVQKLQVSFTDPPRAPMLKPILGVVLHTTNSPNQSTLKEFQTSFQSGNKQIAHFMVDRGGGIGQFRALEQGNGGIGGHFALRYIGIEHIARWKEALTDPQIDASASLVAQLAGILGFPITAITKAGDSGVAFHKLFDSTGCGEEVFCGSGASRTPQKTFNDIITKAQGLLAIIC